MEGTCSLCNKKKKLIKSHRIPKFVAKTIKKDSFTNKLRNASEPNKTVQDSDKDYLLCAVCEKLFGDRETLFNQRVLQPFRNKRITSFCYDQWLNYFITSVSWRTLLLDAKSQEATIKNGFTDKHFEQIKLAEQDMRTYLLGEKKFLKNISNHIVFICEENKLNNYYYAYSQFCNVTSGYTYGKKDGSLYVVHFLAGIMIVSIIKEGKKEYWKNTFVKNEEGKMKSPQIVNSDICGEIDYQLEQRRRAVNNMSIAQKQALLDKIKENPEGFLKSSSSVMFRD
ncbi:hypothetical protein [Priestia megaterium]|uniref:hypothetical protein n=1 Tax=Priestia megaterium TaxID=1404 RepID=UPI00366B6F82